MSSGQTEKTTTQSNTTSQSAPWGPVAGPYEELIKDTQNIYKSGVGSKVYQGSTVIPWSNQTTSGMGDMESLAGSSGATMGKPLQAYSGMMDVLNPIAKGDFSKDTTFLSNLGAAQDAAKTAVGLQMGNMGRFGSAGHAKTLSRSVGDLTNQAMLERQNWASGELGKYGAAMPSAFSAALMPADTKMQVGGMYEDLANREKLDELRKFDATNNAPWEQLARAASIYGGAGQMGGTTTGSSQGTTLAPSGRPSIGQQALGFGTSVLGSRIAGK